MIDKYYVSEVRLTELKEELETLKTKKRQEIAERLKAAKDFGDLSENSEYSEAREEQARVESRIFELEELIKKSVVIEKSSQIDKVGVGSTVKVKRGGDSFTYSIVGPDETEPEKGRISNESPLGRALLGRKVGEKVDFKTPGGEVTYEIISIE